MISSARPIPVTMNCLVLYFEHWHPQTLTLPSTRLPLPRSNGPVTSLDCVDPQIPSQKDSFPISSASRDVFEYISMHERAWYRVNTCDVAAACKPNFVMMDSLVFTIGYDG
jgi:hypothetical protein